MFLRVIFKYSHKFAFKGGNIDHLVFVLEGKFFLFLFFILRLLFVRGVLLLEALLLLPQILQVLNQVLEIDALVVL